MQEIPCHTNSASWNTRTLFTI